MEPKIAFRSFGEGEPVVLLHGFAGSVSHWEPLRPHLSKYYQVIVPNLTHLMLGRQALSFSSQIDELADFLKVATGGKPAHIIGISFGGALAWGIATRYPELVKRIVLINPMSPRPTATFRWKALQLFLLLPMHKTFLGLLLKTNWGKNFLRHAAEIFRNVGEQPSVERLNGIEGRKLLFVAHLIERFAWIVKNERWDIWQNKLEYWIPETLFICDAEDPLISFEAYEDLSQLMGCENFFVTEGAGHISPLNSPQMISWEVMKFLLDKAPRASATSNKSVHTG